MGEEDKSAERVALLKPYQVNKELFDATGKAGTIFIALSARGKGL